MKSKETETEYAEFWLEKWLKTTKSISIKAQGCKFGRCAVKVGELTSKRLSSYLKKDWPQIRKQLLAGAYSPQPVKRVEIPKLTGGIRKLGIPTVLDRFIQQAIMQVLQKYWDKTFSEHSYGFHPG